ncbi:ATP-binding protein [Reichenbachiella sp. MALMAid0571]|uniref:PAS domain-containing sensor histidine kinase n=1 Tax=Reichenbachiella sp. MALMAid0571 TaxID=3143939 RepID=UPI0032DE9FBF
MPLTTRSILKSDKENIVNKALIFGSIIAFITYLLSLSNFFLSGFQFSFITDLFFVAILIITTFYRKKISLETKSSIIILGIIFVILTDIYVWGSLAANKVLLILIPLFSFFSFSVKKTIIIYCCCLFFIGIFGSLHISGHLGAASGDPNTVFSWLIHILMIVAVSVTLFLTLMYINSTYEGMIADLTRSNAKIMESEQNYHEIFNATSDAIVIFDLQCEVVDYNNSLLSLYGMSHLENKESLSKRLFDFDDEFSHSLFKTVFKKTNNHKTTSSDWKIRKDSGQELWVSFTLKQVKIGANDRILAVISNINDKKNTALELEKYKVHLESIIQERTQNLEQVNNDISKQKNELKNTLGQLQSTQDKLIQSEKMASLGLLTSGIAHEINNPLNYIKGGIHGISLHIKNQKGVKDNENIEGLLNGVNDGVNRIVKIINSLNQYVHTKDQYHGICNLNVILENCLIILNNEILYRITIEKQLDPSVQGFLGNPGKMNQAFLNILTNAIQAIPDEGKIFIKSEKIGNNIVITFQDNGVGIPEDILPKISDPFFTTKDVGEGLGLGLFTVYNVIKEHGGNISFESKVGLGTTITIILPYKRQLDTETVNT